MEAHHAHAVVPWGLWNYTDTPCHIKLHNR